MLLHTRSKQEWLNSQSFFYSEFWPRRCGGKGKHLPITNRGGTCFAQGVTLNTVFCWMQLQKFGILETIEKDNGSLFLVNLRVPNVPNYPEDLGAKLLVKKNPQNPHYSSLVFLSSLSEEVRTVPSFCTWKMKVLQILWDFCRHLPD